MPQDKDMQTNALHIFPFSVHETVKLNDANVFRNIFKLQEPQRADKALPRVTGTDERPAESWPHIDGTAVFRGRGMVAQKFGKGRDVYVAHTGHTNPWACAGGGTPRQSGQPNRHVHVSIPADSVAQASPPTLVSWHPDDALFSGMANMDSEIEEFAALSDAMNRPV